MPRTTLAVDEGLAKLLTQVARERKATLYSLVNSLIENCIEILRDGGDVKSIRDLWTVYKLMSQVEAVVVPGDFFDYMVATLYKSNSHELRERFKKLGYDVGLLVKLYASNIDELIQLSITYLKYLPVKRIDYKYVGNGNYEVTLVGVGRRLETTLCMSDFVRGLLDAYEGRIVEEEVTQGLIRVKFVKETRKGAE